MTLVLADCPVRGYISTRGLDLKTVKFAVMTTVIFVIRMRVVDYAATAAYDVKILMKATGMHTVMKTVKTIEFTIEYKVRENEAISVTFIEL